MTHIALCAETVSLQHPEMLGLAGENLAAQKWLKLFSSAEEARGYLRNNHLVDEVWVASCDDAEAINVAAAIKRDTKERRVMLLAFQGSGSLFSRANAAGIDATLSHQAFVERYGNEKRRRQALSEHTPLDAADLAAGGGLPMPLAASVGPKDGSAGSEADGARALRGRGVDNRQKGVRNGEGAGAGVQAVQASVEGKASPAGQDAQKRTGFLLPVMSGSGGAGKSTVSALAALIAHRMGYRTLLLDFDLQFGDMRVMLGQPQAPGIDEVLDDPKKLESILAAQGHMPSDSDVPGAALPSRDEGMASLPPLLAAPRNLEQSERVSAVAPELLDELLRHFDVVVANTGAAWREEHALLLERCTKALLLVDQRTSSLRACKHAVELCVRCGIAASPLVFVANRCSKNALFTSIDVSCAMQGALAMELVDGGSDVEALLDAGLPFELIEDGNPLVESLEDLLLDVLPSSGQGGAALEKRRRGLFGGRKHRHRAQEVAVGKGRGVGFRSSLFDGSGRADGQGEQR